MRAGSFLNETQLKNKRTLASKHGPPAAREARGLRHSYRALSRSNTKYPVAIAIPSSCSFGAWQP